MEVIHEEFAFMAIKRHSKNDWSKQPDITKKIKEYLIPNNLIIVFTRILICIFMELQCDIINLANESQSLSWFNLIKYLICLILLSFQGLCSL